MKTPESLHTKILDAARDEVLKNHGLREWNYDLFALEDIRFEIGEPPYTSDLLNNEAALLAMEKQAGFLLWTFWTDWIYSDGRFMNSKSGDVLPELELYNIWREGK